MTHNTYKKSSRLLALALASGLMLPSVSSSTWTAISAEEMTPVVSNAEQKAVLRFETVLTGGSHEGSVVKEISASIPEGFIDQGDGTWKKIHEAADEQTEDLTEEELASLFERAELVSAAEPQKITSEDGRTGTRTVFTYVVDGMEFIHTRDVFGSETRTDEEGNEIPNELDEALTAAPSGKKTTSSSSVEETLTIVPETIRFSAKAGTPGAIDQNGAASDETLGVSIGRLLVTLEETEDGLYNAVFDLTLSGIQKEEGLSLSLFDANGTEHIVSLDQADENGQLTMTDLALGQLKSGEEHQFSLSLKGERTRTETILVPVEGTGSQLPEDERQEGIINNEWRALFQYSDGQSGLGDAGNFSVFARNFSWINHTNANVAVETLDFTRSYGTYVGIGMNTPAGSPDATDYTRQDLCYIGSFKGDGTFASNNTNSYLILGDSDYRVSQNPDPGHKDLYKFEKLDADGNVIQTVNKAQGNIRGVLKASETGRIDFDLAFRKLTEFANTMQTWTNPNAWTDPAAQQAVAGALEQMNGAVVRSSEGNRDIHINVPALPVSEDGTKFVVLSIDDLESRSSSDQFIFFDGLTENDKVVINVSGLKQDDASSIRTMRSTFRLNGESSSWNKLNSRILLNFGDYAGSISFEKNLYGALLAPRAFVNGNSCNMEGKIIAETVHGENEQHDNGENWGSGGDLIRFEEKEITTKVSMHQPYELNFSISPEFMESSKTGGDQTHRLESYEQIAWKSDENKPSDPPIDTGEENPEEKPDNPGTEDEEPSRVPENSDAAPLKPDTFSPSKDPEGQTLPSKGSAKKPATAARTDTLFFSLIFAGAAAAMGALRQIRKKLDRS